MKIEGQFYVLLGSKQGEYQLPSEPPELPNLPGAPPGNECAKRMAKILAEGTDFDIVRGGTGVGGGSGKIPGWGWGGKASNFNCKKICEDLDQVCVGIGLYSGEKTYCRYIVHNLGMDCQLSSNLQWGECDQEFSYGMGFCEETSPVYGSWGYNDTGCYCMDEYED